MYIYTNIILHKNTYKHKQLKNKYLKSKHMLHHQKTIERHCGKNYKIILKKLSMVGYLPYMSVILNKWHLISSHLT